MRGWDESKGKEDGEWERKSRVKGGKRREVRAALERGSRG